MKRSRFKRKKTDKPIMAFPPRNLIDQTDNHCREQLNNIKLLSKMEGKHPV